MRFRLDRFLLLSKLGAEPALNFSLSRLPDPMLSYLSASLRHPGTLFQPSQLQVAYGLLQVIDQHLSNEYAQSEYPMLKQRLQAPVTFCSVCMQIETAPYSSRDQVDGLVQPLPPDSSSHNTAFTPDSSFSSDVSPTVAVSWPCGNLVWECCTDQGIKVDSRRGDQS